MRSSWLLKCNSLQGLERMEMMTMMMEKEEEEEGKRIPEEKTGF